ncbi:MAG: 16S rRNA (cytosine(1402)-N(4))-methyltransferase RsmH [Flammeovirgaceae bacterium]|jgi:16S rRNA (cytosine1402-N4)-methyltransferase|nr:16S rRNA (cytosine(1402)-N(4))-methyltransferase RsmH [Flammeovirgaceae bacterium]|tara:strand:+ start:15013 stop:15924 length:912 start_codon:yes stop_codon:yes gene_type:complete
MSYHVPVLLRHCIEGLNIQSGGIYVDVTFGGGGHAKAIFESMEQGALVAFDQDPDALPNASAFNSDAKRSFLFVPANFRHLKRFLKFHKIEKVDGILADLGVSSYQFDEEHRGFSTRFDGALDMRMDRVSKLTAAKVVNSYSEDRLVEVLSKYGEIRNAKRLAADIVHARLKAPITSTAMLKAIALLIAPHGKQAKYLAQLFQAIRIEVNDEIESLKDFLTQTKDVLKSGGRLVVISYHSLEDRLVKHLINAGNFEGNIEKDFYGNVIRPYEPIKGRLITPDEQELRKNNRSRSAKLRIGIKN